MHYFSLSTIIFVNAYLKQKTFSSYEVSKIVKSFAGILFAPIAIQPYWIWMIWFE